MKAMRNCRQIWRYQRNRQSRKQLNTPFQMRNIHSFSSMQS